ASLDTRIAFVAAASAANLRASGSITCWNASGSSSPVYSCMGSNRSAKRAQLNGGICSRIARVSARVRACQTTITSPRRAASIMCAALLRELNPAATKMLVSSTTRMRPLFLNARWLFRSGSALLNPIQGDGRLSAGAVNGHQNRVGLGQRRQIDVGQCFADDVNRAVGRHRFRLSVDRLL